MPTPEEIKKFNKKMASISISGNAMRENLFGAYLKEIGAKWPDSDVNRFSTSRTALISFDVCALLNKGHSIDDILDPNKLLQEKHDTAKEVYDNLRKKDVDKEWALNVAQEGCNKILEYIDENSKNMDFNDPSKVLNEKNANVFFLSKVAFDMFQETGGSKGNLPIDEKYPGISMKIGGVGCLFDTINQSAQSMEQLRDYNAEYKNDYMTLVVGRLAAGKEVAKEIDSLVKNNPDKKLSDLSSGRIDFTAKFSSYQLAYHENIFDDGAIGQISDSPLLRSKLVNAFLENNLEVNSAGGEPEIKAKGVDFFNVNQMKEIKNQYITCVKSISNSMIETIDAKKKRLLGKSPNLSDKARTDVAKKTYRDQSVVDFVDKVNPESIKNNITSAGKLTPEFADTIYLDYLKNVQRNVVENNKKQGINIRERKIDPRTVTQGRKVPEDIEMFAKATETIIAEMKKTNSAFVISSKQYSDLWKAIKTLPQEIRKQPDSPEGYKNIQKSIKAIDELAQKYTFSHQDLEKKSPKQVKRLEIMKKIGRFKDRSDRLLEPKIGDNPEKGFVLSNNKQNNQQVKERSL